MKMEVICYLVPTAEEMRHGKHIFSLRGYKNRTKDGQGEKFFSMTAKMAGWQAAKTLADLIIQELGDGDGENGGSGSLRNCYGDIFNYLMCGGSYFYADTGFVLEVVH